MATDYSNIDSTSPALTGLSSGIAAPTSAAQAPMTWQQMLSAIAGLSGGRPTQVSTGLTQGLGSNANAAIPLYTPPLQALPTADEQQKQTSEADVAQYAKILATIFGGGG